MIGASPNPAPCRTLSDRVFGTPSTWLGYTLRWPDIVNATMALMAA